MYNQFDDNYSSFNRFDFMPLNTYNSYENPSFGTGYTTYRNDPIRNPMINPLPQAQHMPYMHMAPVLRPPGMM